MISDLYSIYHDVQADSPNKAAEVHQLRTKTYSARRNQHSAVTVHGLHLVHVQEECGHPGAVLQAPGGDDLHGRDLPHILE